MKSEIINIAATSDSSPIESLEEWVNVGEELPDGNRSLRCFVFAKYINRECSFAYREREREWIKK